MTRMLQDLPSILLSPCIITDLSETDTHLKLKVGLVQEFLVQHGRVLIDGSQEDSKR